jgi:hypothetical protein
MSLSVLSPLPPTQLEMADQARVAVNEPPFMQLSGVSSSSSVSSTFTTVSTPPPSYPSYRPPTSIPFDGSNYPVWSFQMRSLLELCSMWQFVAPEGNVMVAEGDSRGKQLKTEAYYLLVTAIRDPSAQTLLLSLPPGDPKALWGPFPFLRSRPALFHGCLDCSTGMG